ncbi:MAG: hypothetical protein A2Y28_05170 [Chlamydiae bacterium GWC2_50_10]|nr:MAG: hypothetical protein A2Z85_02345 [Chlamydiae bacterium GWA2_50_15]OGN54348.1 MAG: hypothetical protein A2Y28_05170 [Chlamydiae bacterium GWC2_50_10]OGN55118.1 MAG: hypothetical protein A2098_01205 [Chlamydiae bacterium GWF2_49_8]OGN59017.1 MAG: hypothetical protein A3D18_02445 [Chlamydiae bacterium RIFCSPHIGHO2_02_FULL_49_29]OGN62836.1 MAG: hypothetical protein A3E26_03395 [Chlamydiae bacterium RIFCSPHIGHO2_12_FULL_49_32]OGN75229.1 MAG: hypothetical protein A3G30_05335 [Chlamydiae bact
MTGVVFFLAFFLSCAFSSLKALPQGNPAFPQAMERGLILPLENFVSLKGEYLGDVTWRSSFKTEEGVASKGRRLQSELHAGLLIVNILNQFEVYGLAGAMRTRLSHAPSEGLRERKYETPFHPAWGGGGRFIAFYWKRATLGFDGKIIAAHLPVRKISFGNTSVASDAKWRIRRLQGAGALSYQWVFFAPYLGIRYTEVRDRIEGVSKKALPERSFLLKNRHPLGGTVGFGLFPKDYFAINFEARFYDEEGFSLFFDVKF